jgi:hypothetical protein
MSTHEFGCKALRAPISQEDENTMDDGMRPRFYDGIVAFVCGYWWLILGVLVLGLAAYLTRDTWLPLFF